MTGGSLVSRVTLLACSATLLVSLAAGWLGGGRAAAGAVAGGAIATLNFRWVARVAGLAVVQRRAPLLALFGLRHLAAFGVLALVLATGWAHPLAVIAGLSVLPPVLVGAGLREREG